MTCIALVSKTIPMAFLLPAFREQFPDSEIRVADASGEMLGNLADIDVAVCWYPPPGLLSKMPRLGLVQSLAAGVDHLACDPALPLVPVCRIVDPEMGSGMAAYVAWAVIHRQRAMGRYLESAQATRWQEQPIVSPARHRVGIAGLGALGLRCASALQALGYPVRGWSRSAKGELPPGIEAFHGDHGRDAFLAGCDTLVNLLPLTDDTRGVLNARLFARLPPGAHLVNVGRGQHLVEEDLLAALNSGQLGAATLDAFMTEPLPSSHPFWEHPLILVTPHIATRTRPEIIARQTFENLRRIRQGESLATVDRARGY